MDLIVIHCDDYDLGLCCGDESTVRTGLLYEMQIQVSRKINVHCFVVYIRSHVTYLKSTSSSNESDNKSNFIWSRCATLIF